jgi:hypothetical protein
MSARMSISPGSSVVAPATGAYLGTGSNGPFSLRLLRAAPTRVAVLSGGFVAQLLTLRAALSGTSVRVLSSRPSAWAPVLQHAADARIVPPQSPLLQQPGPMLVVDDLSGDSRPLRDVADWQCLVDLRSLPTRAGAPQVLSWLSPLATYDVAVFGVLTQEAVAAATRLWRLDERAASVLAGGLPPQAVALVSRGRAEVVRVDASSGEAQVLRSAVLHSTSR